MPEPSARSSLDTLDSRNMSPSAQQQSQGYPFPRQEMVRHTYDPSDQHKKSRTESMSSAISATGLSVGGALDFQHRRASSISKDDSHNSIANLVHGSAAKRGPTPGQNSTPHDRVPTTRDIPSVTLSTIPHVDPSEFDEYCDKIGSLFEIFKQGRQEIAAIPTQSDPVALDSSSERSDSPFTAQASPRSSIALSPGVTSAPANHRRKSSTYVRRKANEIPPLSTIPSVYFELDFHLENPRIFDVVSERAEIARKTEPEPSATNGDVLPPRKSLASNAILQEKLSWYLDTVEVHLVASISNASASFFAALSSLKALQQEAGESVRRIQELRADLAALNKDMAQGGLEISRLQQKRRNIGTLVRAVRQLELVVQQAMRCEDLADDGHYDAASDLLGELEHLVSGQSKGVNNASQDQHIDLRGLDAMRGLADCLINLHLRIGKGYETRFIEALVSDLRHHVEKVPSNDTIHRWSRSFQRFRSGQDKSSTTTPAYLETDPKLREDLLSTLHGLHRAGHIAQAATGFQSTIMKEMKALVRKHLPSSSNDDAVSTSSVSTRAGGSSTQQERSATLARNLRALDQEDAERLLINVYTNISEAVRRLGVQIKILLDVTSTFTAMNADPMAASNPTSPTSVLQSPVSMASAMTPSGDLRSDAIKTPVAPRIKAQDDLSQVLDMSSLLGQAVDVVQTQISRILKVRAEQTHALPLERFVRYYTLNRLLADECEAVSGRSGQGLKDIVNTQVNAYVQAFGEFATQDIVEKLSSDQWEARDFTDAPRALLERILQGMEHDIPAWNRDVRLWEDVCDDTVYNVMIQNGETNADKATATKSVTPAIIDERRFLLVRGAIAIIPIIDRFLAIVSSMPTTASIVISALCEVLRTLDSRTKQLILGAGATRVAGLKNITTKHLALASQALSFVIALVPYVREGFRRQMSGRHDALSELDKVKRLYQDHQMSIHEKLVDIMTARASSHIKTMQKLDFDEPAETSGEDASPYIETLCRESATLYRVLSKHLYEADVADIMSRILANYKDLWNRAFAEVAVSTPAGRDRFVRAPDRRTYQLT